MSGRGVGEWGCGRGCGHYGRGAVGVGVVNEGAGAGNSDIVLEFDKLVEGGGQRAGRVGLRSPGDSTDLGVSTEDLVAAKDEAPIPPLLPFFLSPRIRPLHTRAAMRQMRATTPSAYHSLLPSGTPPLLPIPLPNHLLAAEMIFQGWHAASEETTTYYSQTWVRERAAVKPRLRALEARVTVLETEVRRHEWQRQAADDLAFTYMRTRPWRLDHALTHWRTLVAVPRLWL
ncbi:hypothetical protein Tco_1503825 [Tanacetum coccineum]